MTDTRNIRERLLDSPGWFAAVFPGTCGQCRKRYAVGAALKLPMPGPLGWTAECCAERAGGGR